MQLQKIFQNSSVLHVAKRSLLKTAMSAKAYSFLSLLFSTQRNFFGKLSLSQYRVTEISLPFSEWKELHTKWQKFCSSCNSDTSVRRFSFECRQGCKFKGKSQCSVYFQKKADCIIILALLLAASTGLSWLFGRAGMGHTVRNKKKAFDFSYSRFSSQMFLGRYW